MNIGSAAINRMQYHVETEILNCMVPNAYTQKPAGLRNLHMTSSCFSPVWRFVCLGAHTLLHSSLEILKPMRNGPAAVFMGTICAIPMMLLSFATKGLQGVGSEERVYSSLSQTWQSGVQVVHRRGTKEATAPAQGTR